MTDKDNVALHVGGMHLVVVDRNITSEWMAEQRLDDFWSLFQTHKFRAAKSELVWTAIDKIGIDMMSMLRDAQMLCSNVLKPLICSTSGHGRLEIAGIEYSYADLGDYGVIAFVGFDVDRDEDDV